MKIAKIKEILFHQGVYNKVKKEKVQGAASTQWSELGRKLKTKQASVEREVNASCLTGFK
jgi:hypothetical protein